MGLESTTHYLEQTEKLRELILYISKVSETDVTFGSTKLNKILFFGDFSFFEKNSTSISGSVYQKLVNGPAPKMMKPLLDAMENEGDLAIMPRDFAGFTQKKPLALREPLLSKFTAGEIAEIDAKIRLYWGVNAKEMSRMSHDFIPGWECAQDKETIPYSISLIDERDLTTEEKKWAWDLDLSGVEALMRTQA